MVVSKSTVGSQHIVTRVFPHTSFSVEYTFHGSARFCWHMVVFRTEGFNCKWLQSLFLHLLSTEKKKWSTFFHCESSVSLPKDFKAGQILDLGKSIPVVVLILQMFFSYLHNCHGQQGWSNFFLTYFYSFFLLLYTWQAKYGNGILQWHGDICHWFLSRILMSGMHYTYGSLVYGFSWFTEYREIWRLLRSARN